MDLLSWQWSSDLVALLLAAFAVYVFCWVRARRRGKPAASIGRLICWCLGLAVVAATILSGIDELATSYFSMHMVQHMLLMNVVPPLGLLARPVSILQAALGREQGGPAGEVSSAQNPVLKAFGFILKPRVAWAIAIITLLLWHIPALYDYALAHEAVHEYGEHLTMVLAFLIWWHPLIGSIPQLPFLATARSRFLYLLATMVPGMLLAVLILFWPVVLYTYYLTVPGNDPSSVLFDQRIGGLVMWAGTMAVLFVMGLPLQYYHERPLSYP